MKHSSLKKSLFVSLLSLLLSVVMLTGTTVAWFSDSVRSDQRLDAGKLDLEVLWTDHLDGGTWYPMEDETHTPFHGEAWEPGHAEVRYIKIVNAGDLALRYQLVLTPKGRLGRLAEAIDVFAFHPVSEMLKREELTDNARAGTLLQVADGQHPLAEGTLLAEGQSSPDLPVGETVMALALKLREDAGSEYQNLTIGAGFSIEVVAAQHSFESDGMGDDFDNPAEFPPIDIGESEANETFAFVFENTNRYIYRVGNGNALTLGKLFKIKETAQSESARLESTQSELTRFASSRSGEGPSLSDVTVAVTPVDETAEVKGTYTANAADWTQGVLRFSGTGLVEVAIQSAYDSKPSTLILEVVDGVNVTAYSELKGNQNSVLLNDIVMNEGGQFALTGGNTLYGNGFTFDVAKGKNGGGTVSSNYLIRLDNATLDNLQVIGAVYTQYGATAGAAYNNPAVLSTGNSAILACCLANCAAPVRVNGGSLTIENTTLKGGNFANLDIRNGSVVLDHVTTINQADLNDKAADGSTVVGLGVVFYYEQVLDTTTLVIRDGLKQYNHLAKTDEAYIKNSSAIALFKAMFNYGEVVYRDSASGKEWVNTGILSMTGAVGEKNIIGQTAALDYVKAAPSYLGKTGYLYAPAPAAPQSAPAYVPAAQGIIPPAAEFDSDKKNYVPKTEGCCRHCYEDGGVVKISFEEGDFFAWDPAILTAVKNGKNLAYTVGMNGVDYTGRKISFTESGTYSVLYSYTDADNYRIENGESVSYSRTYEQTLTIEVVVVRADAKPAEFDFGGLGFRKVTIGNNTYIMPNVEDVSDRVAGKTVNGTTVYMPIVEMITSDGKTEHSGSWYGYFPVFGDTITITDYDDGGNAILYNKNTASMPKGLVLVGDPATVFKYQSSSSAPSDVKTVNNTLYFSSPELSGVNRAEQNVDAEYEYTDAAGNVYHYFVRYHCAEQKKSSCVTPETLVLLADGRQVEVQHLKGDELLLVWNSFTGGFDRVPAAYVVDHDEEDRLYEVIRLLFDDGKEIEIIGEHVFFDRDQNRYVPVSSDAADYIGHRFAVLTEGELGSARLIGVERELRCTRAYEVVSYGHLTCFTNGILSTSAYLDKLLNIFDTDAETLTCDPEAVAKDIERYGLYTYEDFEGLIPEAAFEMYNAAYLKIAVGKGYITWEDILTLIDIYFDVNVTPFRRSGVS